VTVRLAVTPDGRWEHPAAGLDCHEVLALIFGDDESATMTAAEQLTAAAETTAASWVLTVFTTPVTDDLTNTLRRCCSMFTEAGAGMAVEFSPLGPVAAIPDAMKVLRAAQLGGRAGLLIDSWHFFFGDSTFDDLASVPLDDIAYIQFTDALAPESERLVRETLHRRALPVTECWNSTGSRARCSTVAGTEGSASKCSAPHCGTCRPTS
jgi:sugar phosphate isomerase/epimerase